MQAVCSVRDKRAQLCGGLYIAPNINVAARIFSDAILNGADTVIRQHPEDFCLVHVADFDEESGRMIPFQNAETADAYVVVIEALLVVRSAGTSWEAARREEVANAISQSVG